MSEEELRRADEACAADDDLEPDPFGEWLEMYAAAHMDKDTWTTEDLEAAFAGGQNDGWEAATEYYRTGGSFK